MILYAICIPLRASDVFLISEVLSNLNFCISGLETSSSSQKYENMPSPLPPCPLPIVVKMNTLERSLKGEVGERGTESGSRSVH